MKKSELKTIVEKAKVKKSKDRELFSIDLVDQFNTVFNVEAKSEAEARSKIYDSLIELSPSPVIGLDITDK